MSFSDVNRQVSHWIGAKVGAPITADWPFDQLVSLTPSELATHCLVLGVTGSGKSNALTHLFAQDLLNESSVAVLDARGDSVQTVISLCAGNVAPDLVKIFDCRSLNPSHGYDAVGGSGEPYARALSFVEAVELASSSWGVQLNETIRVAAMLLAEAFQPVTRMERLFYDRSFRLKCLESCQTESVREFWHRYDDQSVEKQRTLFAQPVLNKISILQSSRKLAALLSSSRPLNLGEHLNRRGSVTLASFALDELAGAARMVCQLLLASISREVFARVVLPESQRNPLRIYVDELSNFDPDRFESLMAEGRRLKCALVLSFQSLAQLDARMRSIIVQNCGAKLVFRLGREDSATMSRDLFGSSDAFDFAALTTGQAVLWRHGQEPVLIEINEPLIADLEGELDTIRQFTAEAVGEFDVCLENHARQEEVQAVPESHVAEPVPVAKPKRKAGKGALEDWLCN